MTERREEHAEKEMGHAADTFAVAVEEFARQVERLREATAAARPGSTEESLGEVAEQPEPAGPLFYGEDPTLAKRVEEELHGLSS